MEIGAPTPVSAPAFFTEMVLWAPWSHNGTMRARTDCRPDGNVDGNVDGDPTISYNFWVLFDIVRLFDIIQIISKYPRSVVIFEPHSPIDDCG